MNNLHLMQRFLCGIFIPPVLAIALFLSSCKNSDVSPCGNMPCDSIPYIPDTTDFPYIYNYITLLNQPIDTVKHYIEGKWQLEYTLGGWSEIRRHENTFIQFKWNSGVDSIQWYNDSTYLANGPILFSREKVLFDTGYDISCIMNFEYFPFPIPWGWRLFAFRANADSLYLHDDFVDANFYFLTRAH